MSCPATHPTETDIAVKVESGKKTIERHPLRCWHGEGHEGRHGYGAITWFGLPSALGQVAGQGPTSDSEIGDALPKGTPGAVPGTQETR